MIKKILLALFLLPIVGFAQQTSILSHYYENISMFNPSFTGYNQFATVTLNARQQWYKFSDSNIGRSSLTLNKGFNDDGFGLEVFSDNSGNIINSGFKLNYSRRVILDEKSFLFYGLSGGYQNNQLGELSNLDIAFLDNKFNWSPNASFGASYSRQSLLIGISVDGLLESDLGFTDNQNILEKHYYAFAMYDYMLGTSLLLKPSAMYKQAESGSAQFDLNLNFNYKNTLSFGLGYIGNFTENKNFGPLLTIGLNFSNLRSIISQEFTTGEIASYSVGTMEMTLKYEQKVLEKTYPKKEPIEKIEEPKQDKIDTDNDGIYDDEDLCPNQFGSITANGCPDLDKDGVQDSQDMCPNTIGDLLNNGCPILSKSDSSLLEKAMTNLEFDKNSADIKPTSISYLTNIGKLLLANKNMLLVISGHTDSDASNDYNFNLSAKRAQSVRDYFIKMGIKKSRLIIDFYGETMPLVPNTNESNMQKNRRVEFAITFI